MAAEVNPESRSHLPAASRRLFNTPLEYGFRSLFILNSIAPNAADLQRLINYDYLLVHSGDVDGGPPSLHPAVPFRGAELLIKRERVRGGLNLMCARELVEKRMIAEGIFFAGSSLTAAFIKLLNADYAQDLGRRAKWLADHFGAMSDTELNQFMSSHIGQWGAEFERLSAIKELEL